VFKSWQVFVFSLVPLALVFAGVIIGSVHGSDSELEKFAPPPASSSSGGSGGSGGSAPPPAPGTLTLTGRNLTFDKRSLTAPPNTQTRLQFDNQDGGVLHNVAVYTNNRATTKIFVGELTTGPNVTTYTFTTPGAGTYFFRCDSHPDQMTGTFNVR
jgi:plastocyanin